MRCFAVIALLRKGLTERIVALHRKQEDAQETAGRYAAVHTGRFIRFRVRPMDLIRSQVEAICFEWGRADAADGEPLRAERLPKPYDSSYRRGYRVGQKFVAEEKHRPE